MFKPDESENIRKSFPILPDYAFFNVASMAPLPLKSRDAMIEAVNDFCASAYLNMEIWDKTISETRSLAAKITGSSEKEIAFVRNTSDGVSLVASGYPFKEGDEVIINDLEFPSNVYPWLNLERKGVKVIVVKNEGGRVTVDQIAKAVTKKTRIVAISSVQFSTGFRCGIASLGQMARDRGFLLFVDAIQSLGVIPMEAKRWNIDFLSCGGFKWLCGPIGTGIFFCDENRLETLNLTKVGWNSVVNNLDFATIDFRPKPSAGRFEEGTTNVAGLFGLKESLKLLMGYGIDRISGHVLELNSFLADSIRSKGYKILSPWDEEERSGIMIFSARDPGQNKTIVKKLNDSKVLVIERGGGIRVSTHFYNTIEDMERLLELLP